MFGVCFFGSGGFLFRVCLFPSICAGLGGFVFAFVFAFVFWLPFAPPSSIEYTYICRSRRFLPSP